MQIIGPLLVLAMIGLVVLVIMTARRQQGALQNHFIEAAQTLDLSFLEQDDGVAQNLADGFDQEEFARFASSSAGKIAPKNVTHGDVEEGKACLFSHYTRRTEGDARQWFIAIVETPATLSSHGLIKCRSRKVRRVAEIGGVPKIEIAEDPVFSAAFRTQAEDEASARRCLSADVRHAILEAASALDFPVDVQIAGKRVAFYAAQRNFDPAGAKDLIGILNSARRAAGVLAKQAQ